MKFSRISTPIQEDITQNKFVQNIQEIANFFYSKIQNEFLKKDQPQEIHYIKVSFEQNNSIKTFINKKQYNCAFKMKGAAIFYPETNYIQKFNLSTTHKPVCYDSRIVYKAYNNIFDKEKPQTLEHSNSNNIQKEGILIITKEFVIVEYTKNCIYNKTYTDIIYLKDKIQNIDINLTENSHILNDWRIENAISKELLNNFKILLKEMQNHEEKVIFISPNIRDSFSNHDSFDYEMHSSFPGKKEFEENFKTNINWKDQVFMTLKKIDQIGIITLYNKIKYTYSNSNKEFIKINTLKIFSIE